MEKRKWEKWVEKEKVIQDEKSRKGQRRESKEKLRKGEEKREDEREGRVRKAEMERRRGWKEV